MITIVQSNQEQVTTATMVASAIASHRQEFLAFLRHRVNNPAEAEDIYQQALVRAFEADGGHRPGPNGRSTGVDSANGARLPDRRVFDGRDDAPRPVGAAIDGDTDDAGEEDHSSIHAG